MPERLHPKCPLCGHDKSKNISSTPYNYIWTELQKLQNVTFSPETITQLSPSDVVTLKECINCEIQYFHPALPGDSKFYSGLTSIPGDYYNEDKWDFDFAEKHVQKNSLILDIACGSGAWLKRVRDKGAQAIGIDTNPSAIDEAQQAGLNVYCSNIKEFAHQHQNCFDLVTAFQLIEHIPLITPFVDLATSCLKPGGKLILTMPNRDRTIRDSFEPLDHPPHHLTRWSAGQFEYISALTNLSIEKIDYQPIDMHHCRAHLRNLCTSLGIKNKFCSRLIARVIFSPTMFYLYQHLGILDRLELRGMSVAVVFKKGNK